MITLISHFYNEELLLPWWIQHHKQMFDHAILIDYASTDASRAIIAELAPEWTVVDSRNADFDAQLIDVEVMDIERGVEGWKMTLNTTEFLFCADMRAFLAEKRAQRPDRSAFGLPSICMVDPFPSALPLNPRQPLHWQRRCGYFDNPNGQPPGISRGYRFAHDALDGAYHLGRHGTHHTQDRLDDAFILWYGWSPWPEVKARKLQIAGRQSARDRALNLGFQHIQMHEKADAWHAAHAARNDLIDIQTHPKTAAIYKAMRQWPAQP